MINKIIECSENIDNNRTPLQVLSKVMEELGEVASEINKNELTTYKGDSNINNVIEESVDTIITLVDLIYVVCKDRGYSYVENIEDILLTIFDEKLSKWKSKYKKD